MQSSACSRGIWPLHLGLFFLLKSRLRADRLARSKRFMDIHILRDGKQTGPFSEETVQVLLKQGSILINDLAWQPGMPEWLPLHAVLYPASRQQTGEPQPVTDSPARVSHPIP